MLLFVHGRTNKSGSRAWRGARLLNLNVEAPCTRNSSESYRCPSAESLVGLLSGRQRGRTGKRPSSAPPILGHVEDHAAVGGLESEHELLGRRTSVERLDSGLA